MESEKKYPLSVNSVSKSFLTHKVLDNISFNISQGEIFGFIGLNGVGKTTLIKVILDLLKPDSGTVSFFGEDNQSYKSRRLISYLPEKFYPSVFLKGYEFLSISLSYYKKQLDIETAKDYAEKLDLDSKVLSSKIGKYSKGMGQKLGLLSVFLSESPLLILDEPMSGLDPSARIRLKEMLLNYRDKEKSVFFSSHILSDIEEICDKVAVINDGDIIFIGKPSDFIKKHKESNIEKCFLKAIQ